jgi:hypothetical protein
MQLLYENKLLFGLNLKCFIIILLFLRYYILLFHFKIEICYSFQLNALLHFQLKKIKYNLFF